MKFQFPHWLVPVFGALAPGVIALSGTLPPMWQGPVSTLGLVLAGLSGMVMPTPNWVANVHPLIPTSMLGTAATAVALLKQFADGAHGNAKVALYASACLVAWAGGLHAPSPVVQQVQAAAKVLALALLGAALLHPSHARAQGLDWSFGPTIPFLEYDPGNKNPVSVAPGAGVQVSLTHDALKREFLGKAWDLLDLQLMAFGTVVNAQSPGSFGALSAAVGACTMSSLVCVVGGRHLLAPSDAFANGGWFLGLSFSTNIGLAPMSPPTGIADGAAGLERGNHLWLGVP